MPKNEESVKEYVIFRSGCIWWKIILQGCLSFDHFKFYFEENLLDLKWNIYGYVKMEIEIQALTAS